MLTFAVRLPSWRAFAQAHPLPDPMLPDLFESADVFRDRFERGLVDLLRTTGELGEDILVLANANFETRIWEHLHDELRACFMRLAAENAAQTLHGAPDDVATLREILDHDFDTLRPVELRRAGPWELQFNPLRAYRPARHSNVAVTGIRAPFDPARFHFDKPFLRQEIIWEGSLLGRKATLFYNKFPFADYHGLLVPDVGGHRPQFLEPADLAWLWDLALELNGRMPGFGLACNSYGAHASVNHLHFQSFLRETPLPIEDARWTHNGGSEPYPCRCLRFDDRKVAGEFIADLHRQEISYNLILSDGLFYCLPRRKQGEVAYASWLGALAWYEMAGGFPLAIAADFARLDPEEIAAQIAAVDLAQT
ncbi:hypothetical protein [Sulfurisoma sediminicola]|uniref:hypothetical protein n=1 Tax=Sulfurisoma sediminicola TaxID=1381557 RepID=UPI0011C3AECF|nr:hypothetical protein [Sulfurisoma sediminicola]